MPRLGAAYYYAAAALAARASLALLRAGGPLLWRPEVTTPLNSLLGVREGLRLLQLGLSPYGGAACHAPPLVLALHSATAQHPLLAALPNAAADALAALALWRLAARLCRGRSAEAMGLLLGPAALAAAYLWNPLAMLSSIAGTTTPLENLAVMVSLLGGAARNAPLAAAGLAAGAYVGLHPLLLAVPLAIMVARGPEDIAVVFEGGGMAGGAASASGGGGGSGSGGEAPRGGKGGGKQTAAAGGRRREPRAAAARQQPEPEWWRAAALAAFTVLWGAALLALSDLYLRAHPEAQCLPRLAAWLRGGGGGDEAGHPAAGSCWLRSVHGFVLAVDDYTPNIGLFWYFLTELFNDFRPFFKFVLHSHAPILAAPLALRFPARPLLVAWALLLAGAALRPYPSAGDLAPWMALGPLALAPQVARLRSGLLLTNGLLLLAVLGPAMWTQWIIVDAANPNFFYAINLLLGVFYVLVLVQALLLTAAVERAAAGKGEGRGGGGEPGGGGGGTAAGGGGSVLPPSAMAAPVRVAAPAPAPPALLAGAPLPAAPRLRGGGFSYDAGDLLSSWDLDEEVGSHVTLPRFSPELYGNWSVSGPAVIRRVGGSLRALVRAGGAVSLGSRLDRVVAAGGAAALVELDLGPYFDGGEVGGAGRGGPPPVSAFRLYATHAEVSGPFKLLLPGPGARVHGGRCILTVPALSEDNCLLLLPGGCLSHPLCATPAAATAAAAPARAAAAR
ncbi:MAG: GPI transamidase subunit PIG-U-domain-containing protein, partial [Monoraphidium minutum]